MIEIRDVRKRFGTHAAIDGVSLDIAAGSLVALLGPSGCGKTTLLRVLSGLEAPDAGSIKLDGHDLSAQTARERNVGLVFQHYALFRHLDVFENVAFALRVRGRPSAEVDARVRELLALVQLEGLGRRKPNELSGGQRQRVALARALAARPRVLLLDEPFGALDAQVRAELRTWLRRLHDEISVTTIFVTHDQDEAFEVSDRVVVMNRGRIEQVGTPAEVFAAPANDFVMRFLGHVNVIELPDGTRLHARPHELLIDRAAGTFPARVTRVIPLSAGLKIELAHEAQEIRVDVDWERGARLALRDGDAVFLSLTSRGAA